MLHSFDLLGSWVRVPYFSFECITSVHRLQDNVDFFLSADATVFGTQGYSELSLNVTKMATKENHETLDS